ncbi:MAG TPA: ATP-binding protein [Symbiobacteriaceae bacterium]|nr:ATP-binding protein [Symbiobacteriaceae bacterium]
MFRSIQSKLILVYLLLVLVAMEVTGLYLLRQLQNVYVSKVQEDVSTSMQLLVGQLANLQRDGRLESGTVQAYVERWPGEVIVLDENQTVVGTTRRRLDADKLIGQKLTADDVSPARLGTVTRRIGQENGIRIAFEARPVTFEGNVIGVVYAKASLEEAYGRVGDIRDILLVATALALGTTAVMGVALARTITGPIRALTRTAAQIAGGDIHQTIRIRSADEIGQLGETFNTMTKRLVETLGEVQREKNRVEVILTHMADGLIAVDSEGQIIKLNAAAERMLAVEEAEALGRQVDELWPTMGFGELGTVAHETNHSLIQEVRLGSLIFTAHVTPLPGDSQTAGTVIVLQDVTEMQRLAQIRREFVANVSHELKTPLTSVKSYVETLLDGAAEDPQLRTQFLQVVESETDRMTRLVRDLLNLSQFDQGAAQWEVASHTVGPFLADMVRRLEPQIAQKGLSVHVTVAPQTPPARFDRDKISQVMINLLANAIEFTPAGGQIWVEARGEGGTVRFAVRDSGVGIPEADLPRIFERFYRVDKARTRTLGGTGLGLAIAKQIVELSGGTIRINSVLGEGTEVLFTLPVARGQGREA